MTVDRESVARYGINVADVQDVIDTAIAGTEATTVLEGFMRFDLVVRFPPEARRTPKRWARCWCRAQIGTNVPLVSSRA